MRNTDWKMYLGKTVIVDIAWKNYIEVIVKAVSPSGLYVLFERKGTSEWKGRYDYDFCEVISLPCEEKS